MAVVKTRVLRQALESKGFRREESHHTFFILYVEGRKTSVRTKISHGISEYGDSLVSKVRQQMHLNSREFADFVDCPMSEAAYVALLRSKGIVRT